MSLESVEHEPVCVAGGGKGRRGEGGVLAYRRADALAILVANYGVIAGHGERLGLGWQAQEVRHSLSG